jgi:predicted component of type VI protein secretion system
MPKLIVEAGKDIGREYAVEAGMRLGRLDTCAVALDDTNCSREHAEIREVDGAYHVVDLGSRNGTILNGKKVKQAPIAAGDKLTIGDTVFVFYDEDAPASSTDTMGPEALKAAMAAAAAQMAAPAAADAGDDDGSRDSEDDAASDDEREAAARAKKPMNAAAIRAEGAREATPNERALELSLFAVLLLLTFLCVSFATQILLRLLG